MTTDPILNLITPEFWWLWESIIVAFIFMIKFLGPLGKIKVMGLQERNGQWYLVWTRYVSKLSRKVAIKKGESHTVEMGATVYHEKGQPVLFYNVKKTRPMISNLSEIGHDVSKKSYNPDSEDFDQYVTRQGIMQMLKANAIGHPDLMIIILCIAAGAAIGFVVGPLVMPHPATCPLGWTCTPNIPTNATSVQTSIAH